MVRSPIDLRGHAPVQKMKPALPSGADIAAALFTRPAAAEATGVEGDPDASLSVTRHVAASRTTLHFAGALVASTVHQMRDAAFTEVGLRPAMLCLDLTQTGLPDAVATDALVTIGNVARMMGVPFCVRVSPVFARLLEATSLSRLVPLDTDAINK